jgi:NADH-quinone oxidoreductase subunit C
MTLEPAVPQLDAMKEHPALTRLLSWNSSAVTDAKFDRNELSIYIERTAILDAARILRDYTELSFNFLSDVTCVDWYSAEPRFEVVYHLLSISRKERVRLKVKLEGGDPRLASLTSLWPGANFFEREVFDLFGVQFEGHPYLRRIMMPEDWQGHPLRKDYPVEGYF